MVQRLRQSPLCGRHELAMFKEEAEDAQLQFRQQGAGLGKQR